MKKKSNKLEEIQEYWRRTDYISQSFLKKVLVNDTSESPKKGHAMSKGSYVDDLLSLGETYCEDIYYIMEGEFPTKMWREFIEDAVEQGKNYSDIVDWLPLFREKNPKSKLKDDTVLTKLEPYQYYWEALEKANGRVILSQEEAIKCNMVVHNFQSHPNCKHIFESNGEYQVPIYWTEEVDGVEVICKGLIDRLNVDDENKTVRIVDFKTTEESLSKWPRGLARRFNVPFQLSWYANGLNKRLEDLYPGYTQLLPIVLIENIKYPGKPRIYEFTAQDLIHGKCGYKRVSSMVSMGSDEDALIPEVYEKRGWEEALEIYVQCKKLGLEDYDLDYNLNKGKYKLNAFT